MKFEFGEFEIWTLETGHFRLDGGAMFGHVPKTLWEKKIQPDELNRIPLGLRCLLIRTPQYVALIDAGMGNKWGSKGEELFKLEVTDWETLLMGAAGLRPKDVNHVIVTHMHFDHVGGLTRLGEDGKTLGPVFKNAQHWVQKSNFMYASDPSPRERASYRDENWNAWVHRKQLEIVDQDLKEEPRQLLPGLFVERSDGHTIGQQIVHLRPKSGEEIVYAGDLLPTQHHVKESWGMSYDSQPMLLVEEKRHLLERAAKKNWTVILEHDAECPMIRVEKETTLGGRVDFRAHTLF